LVKGPVYICNIIGHKIEPLRVIVVVVGLIVVGTDDDENKSSIYCSYMPPMLYHVFIMVCTRTNSLWLWI
jgi:hypothetical protein